MKETKKNGRNSEEMFFASPLEVPVGNWFAMVDSDIVAQGPNAKEVFETAKKKHPDKEIFIARLPENKVMVL